MIETPGPLLGNMGVSVTFAKGVVAEIVRAAAGSRDEVCGLLLGLPDRVDAMRACRNVASDPTTAFEIDPAALIAAHRAARAGGPVIVGCYHAHPRGDATPSRRDAADAAPNGWLWLIVGRGEARLFRAVEYGAIRGRFDPLVMPA